MDTEFNKVGAIAAVSSGESRSDSDEEELKENRLCIIKDFRTAVDQAMLPMLQRACEVHQLGERVQEQYAGKEISITVQLGPGEDIYLFDGDERFSLTSDEHGDIEHLLYVYFVDHDLGRSIHAQLCYLSDKGQCLDILLKYVCIIVDVTVHTNGKVTMTPAAVTILDEDAFVHDCIEDEIEERHERRKRRKRT